MNKLLKSTALIICIFLFLFTIGNTSVKAEETASVAISSATVETGETVTVNVTVSSNTDMLLINLWLSYDKNVLEYISGATGGGGGSLLLSAGDGGTDVYRTMTFKLKFKAIKAGSSSVYIDKQHAQCFVAGGIVDNMTLNSGTGTVSVNIPTNVSYSSNNNLSSLTIATNSGNAVTLSPGFSPSVTNYTATVGSDCSSLVINAPSEDASAKVSITGKTMDPGFNTTTITVTAEDGSVKKYIIKTTKENGITNQTTANNATTAATTAQTAPVINQITTTVNGLQYNIIKDLSNHPMPDGYEATQLDYNGQQITVGKGSNGLTIMYLEKVDGSGAGDYYIYDIASKTFSQLSTVTQPVLKYTILPITSSMEIPAGYTKSTLTINGNIVDVLTPSESNGKYCLFYGVDDLGNSAWYRYDFSQQTVQKYYGAEPVIEEEMSDNIVTPAVPMNNFWKILSGGIAFVTIILFISVVLLILKLHARKSNDFTESEDSFNENYKEKNFYNDNYEEDNLYNNLNIVDDVLVDEADNVIQEDRTEDNMKNHTDKVTELDMVQEKTTAEELIEQVAAAEELIEDVAISEVAFEEELEISEEIVITDEDDNPDEESEAVGEEFIVFHEQAFADEEAVIHDEALTDEDTIEEILLENFEDYIIDKTENLIENDLDSIKDSSDLEDILADEEDELKGTFEENETLNFVDDFEDDFEFLDIEDLDEK